MEFEELRQQREKLLREIASQTDPVSLAKLTTTLRQTENKIVAMVGDGLIEDLAQQVADVFLIYKLRFRGTGNLLALEPFVRMVHGKITPAMIEHPENLKRAEQLLAEHLE